MVSCIAACVQLNSQDEMSANLLAVKAGVHEAAARGAVFITLPENTFFMQAPGGTLPPPSPEEGIAVCQSLARELGVWVLIGSVQARAPEGKYWNRSVLINDRGQIVTHYDKIHRFDATLRNGEAYNESARIAGGEEAVLAPTPLGIVGMTICYDARFPHLYRTLAQAGATCFTVPAAFTYTTGTAHWHVLLRARAIENGCYVLAPAQCGQHPGKRRTYGHSMIIAPWGDIVAEASEDTPGVITATLDTDRVEEARTMIPSLKHDRVFQRR